LTFSLLLALLLVRVLTKQIILISCWENQKMNVRQFTYLSFGPLPPPSLFNRILNSRLPKLSGVGARIYWPHVLCYLRELYNLLFDNMYTHYTFRVWDYKEFPGIPF